MYMFDQFNKQVADNTPGTPPPADLSGMNSANNFGKPTLTAKQPEANAPENSSMPQVTAAQDIFADTDRVAPPKQMPNHLPVQPPVSPTGLSNIKDEAQMLSKSTPVKGVLIVVIIVLFLVAVYGIAAWYFGLYPFKSVTIPENNINTINTNTNQAVNQNQAPNNNAAVVDVNKDTDADGLTDNREKQLGTNPLKSDSDSDDLFDKEEVDFYKTDPLNPDTDGDGVNDGQEQKNGTNPLIAEQGDDIDNMVDDTPKTGAIDSGMELPSGGNTNNNPADSGLNVSIDTDNDGLRDYEEQQIYHTDPKVADTDKDGLSDGDEVNRLKTDPLNMDSDADGYSDGQEVQNGYNPLGEGTL
jgi:hypothetical protein